MYAISSIGNDNMLFYFKFVKYAIRSPTVTAQCRKTMSNLSNFRCRLICGVGKVKIQNFYISLHFGLHNGHDTKQSM